MDNTKAGNNKTFNLSTNLTKKASSTGISLSLSGQKEETATYNGSNNNYLKKLSVKGINLNTEFNKENTTYFINVTDKSKLKINYKVEANSYVAKGEKILKYTNGTYLTAPYDCYIVELKVPEFKGKCLNSHYVKIQSKNMLTVSMNVSETKISKISIGQEAVITIPALEKEYKGYVTHIGSTASNGKFTIDIEFENDGDIKLGMTSTVQISI